MEICVKMKTDLQNKENEVADIINFVGNNDVVDIENDNEFKKAKHESWIDHSKQYSKLLESYVTNSCDNLETKRCQKKWFFGIAIAILCSVVIGSGVVVFMAMFAGNETSVKIAVIVPTFITLFASLLAIPNVIAKYLFNSKEEEHLIEIVGKMIEHDSELLK